MTKELSKRVIQSPKTLFVMFAVGLVLTYALATRAIDTGSLGQYGLTLLFLALTVKTFIQALRAIRI